ALALSRPQARPGVDALLRTADVVLHNFRVGVAERLGIDAESLAAVNPGAVQCHARAGGAERRGIDAESLAAVNPGAVHCHASAFGGRGPRAAYPGNDALMQAV